MMDTLLAYVPALAHTQRGHPESHERMLSLMPALERYGVLADLSLVEPMLASPEMLERVHVPALVARIQQVAAQGGGVLDLGDTYAVSQSYELARMAAGAVSGMVEQIVGGTAVNGLALVRPPGHHAESKRVSGFCLFNNVAVAARHAQAVGGVRRIMIVDFDVHHGNGTQEIFYGDDTVLFVSMHLYLPRLFYPGTGALRETGQGVGEGYTVNVPLPAFVGDVGYGRILQEIIYPKARTFQPELILVSAGFDAHWQDPLAMAGLSLRGYAEMCRQLVNMADELCNGRILFVLEGGYHHQVLTFGILNLAHALLHHDQILDPLGAMTENEQDITPLVHQLQKHHLLK
ncbi:MAG: histone deacetylase [Chloroflexi bacterium]|nr:MAG: histone deacetylase [Chloroflexota bacterium]